MSDTIWTEDFVKRNPKLAKQAIDFLQEMLQTQELEAERTIGQLKGRLDGLELELALLREKKEE